MTNQLDRTIETDNPTLNFTIEADTAETRLDAFLAKQITDWSRARIQKVIDEGATLVNDKPAKSSLKLRAGDKVEIELPELISAVNFAPEDLPLDIVHEDDALIVVNKSAGMVTHPAAGTPSGTLANALAFHFQNLPQRGGAVRPGIVHRLDKDTSGLMVVAKTETAHENLSDQFRNRTVYKSYTALVHGVIADERGDIIQPIGRHPQRRTIMAVVPAGRGGRYAHSIYRVQQRFGRFTLLKVKIKTGRTHQIRVHLQWAKHPIVGDENYNDGRDKVISDPVLRAAINKLNRPFLHAARLAFEHPTTGERLLFEAELPEDLRQLLSVLE